jgi:hypothetical protein
MPYARIARIVQVACFIGMGVILSYRFGDSGDRPSQPNFVTGQVIAIHDRSGVYYVSHAQEVTAALNIGGVVILALISMATGRYIRKTRNDLRQ